MFDHASGGRGFAAGSAFASDALRGTRLSRKPDSPATTSPHSRTGYECSFAVRIPVSSTSGDMSRISGNPGQPGLDAAGRSGKTLRWSRDLSRVDAHSSER